MFCKWQIVDFMHKKHILRNKNIRDNSIWVMNWWYNRLTCATLMPVQKLMTPLGWTAWSFDRILPVSGVSVVRTSQLLQHTHTHSGSPVSIDFVTFVPVNKTNRLNQIFILLGQSDEPHVVFGVSSSFWVTDDVDSVLLGLKSGR